jgi:hypothetical protein
MGEEIRYPVCPQRNVPAAFQRFFGPDSGGFERFFPDERMQRLDGTLLIVRLGGKKAVNRALHAVEDFNAGLAAAWTATASACWSFALASGQDATQLIARTAALLFGARPARLPA